MRESERGVDSRRSLLLGAGAWLVGFLTYVGLFPTLAESRTTMGFSNDLLGVLSRYAVSYHVPWFDGAGTVLSFLAPATLAGYYAAKRDGGTLEASATAGLGYCLVVATTTVLGWVVHLQFEDAFGVLIFGTYVGTSVVAAALTSIVAALSGGGIYRVRRAFRDERLAAPSSNRSDSGAVDPQRAIAVGILVWVVGVVAYFAAYEWSRGFYDAFVVLSSYHWSIATLVEALSDPLVASPLDLYRPVVLLAGPGTLLLSIPAGYYLASHSRSNTLGGASVALGFGSIAVAVHVFGEAIVEFSLPSLFYALGVVPMVVATAVLGGIGGWIYWVRNRSRRVRRLRPEGRGVDGRDGGGRQQRRGTGGRGGRTETSDARPSFTPHHEPAAGRLDGDDNEDRSG